MSGMNSKIDNELLKKMSLFEKITDTTPKDCFEREEILFIVPEGTAGKAIGKKGRNVKKLSKLFEKRVKIAEFSQDRAEFIKNLLPVEPKSVKEENGVVTLFGKNRNDKGKMIGVRGQNLRKMEDVVQQYFSIEEIKVK